MMASQFDISQEDSNFKVSDTRIGFVRKVLGIVGAQLVVTAAVTAMVLSSDAATTTIQTSTGLWVTCFILSLFISIALICSKTLSRTVPYNYAALFLFTLCESYGVAGICTMYEVEDVALAAFLAGVLTVTLVAYSYYLVDFEMLKYLGVMTMTVVLLMICQLFFGVWDNTLLISLGLFIYGIYLIVDVQRLLNESRFGMTLDDYIVGAMLIYLDIIMIFIKILELVGKKKN